MKVVGNADKQDTGRWLNNRAENLHQPVRRRRAGDAALQPHAKLAETRLHPFLGPQSFQAGTRPLQPRKLQA